MLGSSIDREKTHLKDIQGREKKLSIKVLSHSCAVTIPDHPKTFFRKLGVIVFEHSVQVLVVAPRHHQIFNAALWFVHTIRGTETYDMIKA